MAERLFFQPVSDSDPFRQGDIICLGPRGPQTEPRWGVIITADCDIAQQKMGDFFTFVNIVTARYYVEVIWAEEELLKLRSRLANSMVATILATERLRDPNVRPLRVRDLLDWVHEDGSQSVVDSINIKPADARIRALQGLETLRLADDARGIFETPLMRLRACWRAQGRTEKQQQGLVSGAINQNQMRSEYFLVPILPRETEIGFVITLRDIRSLHKHNPCLSG